MGRFNLPRPFCVSGVYMLDSDSELMLAIAYWEDKQVRPKNRPSRPWATVRNVRRNDGGFIVADVDVTTDYSYCARIQDLDYYDVK